MNSFFKRCVLLILLPVFLRIPAPALAKDFQVLTSVYPIYVFTKNVIGAAAQVNLDILLSPGKGSPHDYVLTPADLKKIAAADLFVINGAGLEEYLDKVRKEIKADLTIVDSSSGISLISGKETSRNKRLTINPHTFVSPKNAIIQVRNIAAALKNLDPANADLYQKNAETYIATLQKLLTDLTATVKEFPSKKIVTFHNAFAYFARDIGLDVVGVIEPTPGQEPSSGELAALVRLVKNNHLKAVFAEPQFSPKLAEVLAKEAGVFLYYLDPAVTGGGYNTNAYEKIMRHNLMTLKKILGE